MCPQSWLLLSWATCATPRKRSLSKGFTLIEVLIVVAMIAILAAVALPAYQNQIRKSRRAEAQSFLLVVAARQQQFLLDTRAFAGTVGPTGAVSPVGVPVPPDVDANYTLNLAVDPGPPPTYSVTATPVGAQAAEACGTLSIDQAGVKTPADKGCW